MQSSLETLLFIHQLPDGGFMDLDCQVNFDLNTGKAAESWL